MNINSIVDDILDEIIEARHYLHKHPELSMHEFNTQQFIINKLELWKIPYQTIAKTGVLAIIEGQKGNCVLVRADIDALPITEENNIPYKSIYDGVMHACGHDAHTAILLGTAYVLQQIKSDINGTVKCIFQPNEEVSGGAKDCVLEGVMEHPKVDYVIGLHAMPTVESGHIEIRHGTVNASTGTVSITIHGKEGHAAYPESGIDSIRIASQVVSELYHHFDPIPEVVLTFGKISGGVKTNIIAKQTTIEGTLRCLTKESREISKNTIIKIVDKITKNVHTTHKTVFEEGYPVLINDSFIVDKIIESTTNIIGLDRIIMKEKPSMGGEDFGYYQEYAKGAFFNLGCKTNDFSSPLHSSTFQFDDNAIKTGILVEVETILNLLNNQ